MAASETSICNRALQKLGVARITALSDDSKNARSCLAVYEHVRDALLEEYHWSFAITRIEVAADATEPDFGKARSFSLPADCLAILPPYPEELTNDRDWIIEGRQIFTDDVAPLELRYLKKETDVSKYTPLFREALSMRIAEEIAEELTQSNVKKQDASDSAQRALIKAKRADARGKISQEAPEDTLITVRL